MAIPIPGGDILGYGFDVFGRYDASSKKSPLFNIQYDPSKQWQGFLLPQNASFDSSSSHYGTSYSFNSRSEVEQHFATKVGITGKYNMFNGEFSASYSQTVKQDQEYQYGLMEAFSQFWSLDLKDRSAGALADWVTNDPDFKNLPTQYTAENRYLFFRFFDKYGTYFVTGVNVGARLFYTCSVLKNHQYSEQEVKTKIKAEYNAVFIKVGAEAEAEWKKIGQQWSDARSVSVNALGGNNSILIALAPGFPDNFSTYYKSWLDSCQAMPSTIDFRLASMDTLFSGNKAQAVKSAMDAYTKARIYAESKTGTCVIYFNGQPILPAGSGEVVGMQLAVLDRQSLDVVFSKSYNASFYNTNQMYLNALSDIKHLRNSKHIFAFCTWSMLGICLPPKDFYDFLVDCGAGYGLESWENVHNLPQSNPHWYSCDATHVNYVLVGIPGIGKSKGHESFERAGSCDTGDKHWHAFDAWLALPAPMANVEVEVLRLQDSPLVSLTAMQR
ncbi:MAG: MAC/perforin domain-containing protein [Chlorobiales bacterium]|nr:MAC/perforin domain-containing protein [Chlorobiales bacterium]